MKDIGISDQTLHSWRLALRHALASMVRLYKPDFNLARYYGAPDATILDLYNQIRDEYTVTNALPTHVYALAIIELTHKKRRCRILPQGSLRTSKGRISQPGANGARPSPMAAIQRLVL